VKGPFERLRHNFKRTWECPECRQRRRTSGQSTSRACNCRVLAKTGDIVWMTLIRDAPQARCPIATNLSIPDMEQTAAEITAAENTAENEQR